MAERSGEILLNGRPRILTPGQSLAQLLVELELDPRWVVAELNGEPLGRDRFGSVTLQPGDRLELVRPVAGG
ncbi:MAG: sulfur carrier protein ThiS [bacterium]|nr:sulfur carrier protein ThiS [Gemmatimonadota bacterium]